MGSQQVILMHNRATRLLTLAPVTIHFLWETLMVSKALVAQNPLTRWTGTGAWHPDLKIVYRLPARNQAIMPPEIRMACIYRYPRLWMQEHPSSKINRDLSQHLNKTTLHKWMTTLYNLIIPSSRTTLHTRRSYAMTLYKAVQWCHSHSIYHKIQVSLPLWIAMETNSHISLWWVTIIIWWLTSYTCKIWFQYCNEYPRRFISSSPSFTKHSSIPRVGPHRQPSSKN